MRKHVLRWGGDDKIFLLVRERRNWRSWKGPGPADPQRPWKAEQIVLLINESH